MDNETNAISQKIKRELSDFLGIGIEDVEDESEFEADFHMSPTDMTDFLDILNKAGFTTEHLDLTQIETFSDLIEQMTSHV
jgi:acyl carrier protein